MIVPLRNGLAHPKIRSLRQSELVKLKWEWEFKVNEYSVFILPDTVTKNEEERIVVCNSIAQGVLESRRGIHATHVFTYKGNPVKKLNTAAWRKAWKRAGLPINRNFTKGIHNIRHTCGRRLRAAGVRLETRKVILGHKNGDITTHYSQAEIQELRDAVELLTNRRKASPALKLVGKVSETKKQLKVA
jgi:integrase